MSHILLIDLDRARDGGFTVSRHREQHSPAANDPLSVVVSSPAEDTRKQRAKEEFERATTPFPGG